MNSKYLDFKLVGQKPRTLVYDVLAKRTQIRLGTIKWYFNWRQYGFFPERGAETLKFLLVRAIQAKEPEKVLVNLVENWAQEELVFTAGCEADITSFLQELNMQQRKGKISFKNTPRGDARIVPIVFEGGSGGNSN